MYITIIHHKFFMLENTNTNVDGSGLISNVSLAFVVLLHKECWDASREEQWELKLDQDFVQGS